MNNNNKKIQESRKIILSIISIFTLLLIVPLVKAPADWTRVYCLYNAGSGGTACDSGQVGGDSASCSITNKCEEEGDIYCYAQSYNPIKGTTTAGPKNVDNVNWDTDQNDCECYVGNSACNNGICWGPIRGFGFESGTSPNCCGDNTDEYYKWQKDYGSSDPIVDSPIQTNEDNDACCNSVDSCVWDTTCFPKDSVIDYDGDGKTDSYCENNNNWADCDLEASVCETYCGYEWGVGLGDANADGGFSLTNCCGDDAGEYYIDGTATLSGAACCDSETDCVDADNICQPDRAVTTYNDHQYTCTDGEWNDDGRINGISCSNNSVCASGFCTDGYCCDSACDSLCQVCDLEGSLGSCTNIPVGTDPYDECTAENCFTGYCSGNASCDAYADDQQHNCANVCQYCHNGNPDGSCDSRPEGTQTGDCIDNH
ncbi:MAG: hypothetical protein KAU20_04155, partial [Nanoarchaeota archaeon]|nr:hypothetical protein [Nanoarchaeota archaeon]